MSDPKTIPGFAESEAGMVIDEQDSSETPFSPDWVSAPGATIRSVIGETVDAQESLSKQLGLSYAATSALLDGFLRITPALAISLADAVGSTPKFWAQRERRFREGCERLQGEIDRLGDGETR